jgi:hypothetical protein
VPVSPGHEKPYRLGVALQAPSFIPSALAASFAAVFEGLVAKAAAATSPETMLELHRAFEARTGAFGPDDPWFESRSRAFWDDTMTRQRASVGPLGALGADEQLWAEALSLSHRGLFESRHEDGMLVLSDVLSGAELRVHEIDDASRDSLESSAGFFDGTVVAEASSLRFALLPGAIFHPEEADDAIVRVIAAARARSLSSAVLLDALLRMELSLRTLSRVKPSYAYRVEALPG